MKSRLSFVLQLFSPRHVLQLHCTLQSIVKGLETGTQFLQAFGSGRWIQEFKVNAKTFLPGRVVAITYSPLEERWIFKELLRVKVQSSKWWCLLHTESEHKNWRKAGWQQEIIQIYKMMADTKVNCTLCLPNLILCGDDYFIAPKIQPFVFWVIKFLELVVGDKVAGDAY